MGAVSTRHAGKRSRSGHSAQARRGEGGERREGDQLLPQPRADGVRDAAGARVGDPLAARRGREEAQGGRGRRQAALRADFERAREFFGGELPTDGARGLAVFFSGENDLFEVIRLPRSVQSEVVISDSPFIEPLVDLVSGSWCILLCNRRTGRIFRGSSDRIEEVARITSEDVPPQADAGGLSQSRYERGQDEEVHRHLKRVADVLHRRFRRARFDHLLIGSPEELTSDVERTLHPDIAQRLAGRLSVDVENTTDDDVLATARPLSRSTSGPRSVTALDRLKQGVGAGGRGVAGLDDALGVLNERRVETLLIEERFQMPGRVCPQCGSLFPENVTTCPADETATEPVRRHRRGGGRAGRRAVGGRDHHPPPRRPRADGRGRRGAPLLAVAGLAQEAPQPLRVARRRKGRSRTGHGGCRARLAAARAARAASRLAAARAGTSSRRTRRAAA